MSEGITVIMPTIVGYTITTSDEKTVISEHGSDELNECRKMIEGTNNIIKYIFKEIDEDEFVD